MSDYEWYKYSGEDWHRKNLAPSPSGNVVIETEKPLAVIYDHNGQPYGRPRVPMGFIDPNNLPGKK